MTSGPHPPSSGNASQMRLTPTVPTEKLPEVRPMMPAQGSGVAMADAGTVQTDGAGMGATSEPEPISPPSGPITDRAPCCPDVATFEGSTGGWETYFGFDDKTNSVENKGQDEYWSPPNKGKTLPSDKETRDGARWVSVAVGHEAQVEVNFGGNFTTGCLTNCTYEVEPAGIAEVTSPLPTSSGAALKIKGLAEGEASLKVMCNGEVKGYFHIWCKQPLELTVNIVRVKSAYSRPANFDVGKMNRFLNDVYGQAVIKVKLRDLDTVDMSLDDGLSEVEGKRIAPDTQEYDPSDDNDTDNIINYTFAALGEEANDIKPNSIFVVFYAPDKVKGDKSGRVTAVGEKNIVMLTDNPERVYGTLAHEIGHALGLVHPGEPDEVDGGRDQFPAYQYETLNIPTEHIPATNTEPEVPAGMGGPADPINGFNMLAVDPLNLEGYYPNYNQQIYLRYRQWKALYETVKVLQENPE